MKSKSYFLLVVFSLFTYACERTITIKKEQVSESLGIQINSEKYILIVPQNGCSNCVYKSYQLIQKHSNLSRIKFVFTNFSSAKAVKIRLSQIGVPNVDTIHFTGLEQVLDMGGSSMFPLLIHLEDNLARLKLLNDPNDQIWVSLNEELSGTRLSGRLF
ncbi:MAG: hypothetical protein ACJAS3_000776 [Roseivirga sp.]|jgi:hypothetical protein